MTTKCVDCGRKKANRSKKSLRCRDCWIIYKSENKTGRILPECIKCGIKISAKKNVTGMCKKCFPSLFIPWNKGLKGSIPWNKGISRFESKEDYRINMNKLRKERRKFENIQVTIADRARTLIRNQLKKKSLSSKKGTKTEKLLGCDPIFYRKYIENLWVSGMSWNNYGNGKGKWNIDHICAVRNFDLTKPEEVKKCFHFTNTQPLWAIDNIKKG